MIWIGIAVVLVTIYLLIKQYETRMVLLAAGFAMAILAGNPMAAFKAFSDRMVFGGLIEPILSVMGFAFVMKYTKCDQHLIHCLTGVLRRVQAVLIPGAVLVTFFINTSLISAAGVSAAVGAILIPLLMSMGVSPAIAGAAVMAGTFGSMLSPGLSHNPFVAKIANVPVMEVIGVHYWATTVSMLIGAVALTVVAVVLKENKGYVPEEATDVDTNFSVNPLYAIVPLVPLIILVAGSTSLGVTMPWIKALRVSHCMLIGAFLALAVTRSNPAKATKEFFDGCGMGYGSIMGIIIGAAVFTGGMDAIGLIKAFNEALKQSESVARVAAAWGPFILAVVSGSGDAAALTFNEAVTPHAAEFGMKPINMGSLAALSGALGRTMSPLTGACIICASIAKANPMDLAKRNAPGMVIAGMVVMFMLT